MYPHNTDWNSEVEVFCLCKMWSHLTYTTVTKLSDEGRMPYLGPLSLYQHGGMVFLCQHSD